MNVYGELCFRPSVVSLLQHASGNPSSRTPDTSQHGPRQLRLRIILNQRNPAQRITNIILVGRAKVRVLAKVAVPIGKVSHDKCGRFSLEHQLLRAACRA